MHNRVRMIRRLFLTKIDDRLASRRALVWDPLVIPIRHNAAAGSG